MSQRRNLELWIKARNDRKAAGLNVAFAAHPLANTPSRKPDHPYADKVEHEFSAVFSQAYPGVRFWAFGSIERRDRFLASFPEGRACGDPVTLKGDFE